MATSPIKDSPFSSDQASNKQDAVRKWFFIFEVIFAVVILYCADSHTITPSATVSSNPARAAVIITQDSSTSSRASEESGWWFWKADHTKLSEDDDDDANKLPENCTGIVQRAKCTWHGIYATAQAPATMDGLASACVDDGGWVRSSADINAEHLQITGIDLPPCAGDAPTTAVFERAWWLWNAFVQVFVGYATIEILYTASLPLKYGEEGHRTYETLTYFERLTAVASLWLITGGGPMLFGISEVYMLYGIWGLRGTWAGMPLEAAFVVWTYVTVRPLPHRFPLDSVVNHWCLQLWIRYFDVKMKSEFAEALAEERAACGPKRRKKNKNKKNKKKFLLAQMPHGVMPFGALLGATVLNEALPDVKPVSGVVATALLRTPVLRHLIHYFGVREAGSAMIHQMFADGYEAVAVVAGGIAEMFVSKETEILTKIRKNFGKIALVGGHDIVIIFGFGVSRTMQLWPLFDNRFNRALSRKGRHDILIVVGIGVSRTLQLWPFFDNRFNRALSRKIKLPTVLFGGASVFGLVPHRQQLKLVVSRPIEVEQVAGEVSDEQALELCGKVEEEVKKLYERHRPFWETRPIRYTS